MSSSAPQSSLMAPPPQYLRTLILTDSGSVVVEYFANKLWEASGRHIFALQLRSECQLAVEGQLKEFTA